MKKLLAATALVAVAFAAAPVLADTIAVGSIPIAGTAGDPTNMHVVTIDGATCKVKNSVAAGYPSQGCNYNISLSGIDSWGKGGTWTVTPQQQNNCSTKCE